MKSPFAFQKASTSRVRALGMGAAIAVACVAAVLPAGLRAADGADPLPRLTALLGEASETQFQLDLLRGITAALQGRRSVPMPAGWEAVEARLVASGDAQVRSMSQALALKFGSQKALASLRTLAADAQSPADARRGALDSLIAVRDPGLPPLLQKLASDPAVRGVAIRALAGFDDAGTPAAILGVFPGLDAAERRDALNTLASRTGFARALIGGLGSGVVKRADLTADLVRQLRNLKDADISKKLDEVWGVMKETSADQKKEIERMNRLYWAGGSTPGDAPRGRAVFNQVCAQCHHLFDFGGNVGPDITGANRSDLNYLLENILFPNAVIPNDYRASMIETKDDRVITGIVKEQTANAVVVQAATELLTLPRNEVKKIEPSEQSMMPEGLLANLKDQEVRDLLYYLSRPGQVPLPAK